MLSYFELSYKLNRRLSSCQITKEASRYLSENESFKTWFQSKADMYSNLWISS